MIYLQDNTANRLLFEGLLEKTRSLVLLQLKSETDLARYDGAAFEKFVCITMQHAAIGTPFEDKLVQTPDREFPDIVDNEYFGVEVKVTKKNDWKSIGNSVLESSRVINIEKIYVFFGKLGGGADVRVRSYEECLSGIAVTHYPRYKINMDLEKGATIFDLMGIEYNALRKEGNPVKHIRSYYSSILKDGQELWWASDDLDDSTASTPVIQTFSSLSADKKNKLKAEAFVLFPEVFSTSTTKFEKVAAHWITKHNLVCSNVRDVFTAGGQATLTDSEGKEFKAPKIVGELIELAPLVEEILNEKGITDLSNSWGHRVDDHSTVRSAWIYELNKKAVSLESSHRVSDIYGLYLKKHELSNGTHEKERYNQ